MLWLYYHHVLIGCWLQILFLAGLAFIIGFERTFWFFFQRHKLKGSSFFFTGTIVVLLGWPLIGMIIESYGFICLFGGFIPAAVSFLRRIPVLGTIFNLPGISSVMNRIGGDSSRSMVWWFQVPQSWFWSNYMTIRWNEALWIPTDLHVTRSCTHFIYFYEWNQWWTHSLVYFGFVKGGDIWNTSQEEVLLWRYLINQLTQWKLRDDELWWHDNVLDQVLDVVDMTHWYLDEKD